MYVPSPLFMKILLRSAIKEPITALDRVSFDVHPGQVCAVVGPNGAGKSTLFRILTGLTTPTGGTATVAGHDATRDSNRVRRLVGFMPAEDRTLFLRLTVVENLVFHGRLQGLPERVLHRRITQMLELVELAHARDRVGFALSSGMRARLQLARALLHQPPVLILDEPTGTVDPVAAYRFVEIIKQVAADQQVAVLLSSHRLDEIEALHDSVVLLDSGKLVYHGDLDSLRKTWERPMIELRFDHEEAAAEARRTLKAHGLRPLAPDEPAIVLLGAGHPVGVVLELLDGQRAKLASVGQPRMPLRELLATMLGGQQPPIPGSPGQASG